ncbi:MAG TPA: complex I subunit 1 family protein, partial [Polyangiaceae bacterium]|nr:complex I subunit 1 family protein [Polyangiaceae bacterium]
WADRRQGAMLQDRVGPNRAVVWLPRWLAQGLALIPALLVSAAVLGWVATTDVHGMERTNRAILFSQLAILMTWLTGLVIAARVQRRGAKSSFDVFIRSVGDPRKFFFTGLFAHTFTLLLVALFRDSPGFELIRDFFYGGGAGVLVFAVLFGAAYAVWSLRKEERIGLRLAGLLHPAADGLKTLFKEDFIPPNADRFLHSLAPLISFFPALVVLAVVPFGDTLCFGLKDGTLDLTQLQRMVPREGVCADAPVRLQVLNLNVGILYFFALAGTGIVGAALAGWASDNKFSLMGGLRAASQMVSYEVTMGLTVVGALMVYGTLRLDEMVRWQAENTWGIFVQPLAFFLFFAAAVAESKRIPFDLPEGESELVAGYYTEYSGMKFAMFFFAEYVAVVTSSALMVALFFGGWHLPFVFRDGINIAFGDNAIFYQPLSHGLVVLLGFLAFIFKTLGLCFVQLTIRWTLPRFRYDQLMRLGWRKLLPVSLVNILVTGAVILAIQSAGPSVMNALRFLGDVSMGLIAVAGAVGLIAFVSFVVQPPKKRRLMATSSAKFAAALGGTRTARMEA